MKEFILALVCLALFAIGTLGQEPVISPMATKVVEYKPVNTEVELRNMDMFQVQLQNMPNDAGVIIVYPGRKGRSGEAKAIIKRMKNYLLVIRRFNTDRLTFLEGGPREKAFVELWDVPPGAEMPKPTPTVFITKKVAAPKGSRDPSI